MYEMEKRRLQVCVGALSAACILLVSVACMHQQRPDTTAVATAPTGTRETDEEALSEHPDIAGYCEGLRNSSDPFFGTQQRARLEGELENPTFTTLSWRTSIARELARDHLRFGEAEEAIRLLREALDAELQREA